MIRHRRSLAAQDAVRQLQRLCRLARLRTITSLYSTYYEAENQTCVPRDVLLSE
jgi:hypothetical protein